MQAAGPSGGKTKSKPVKFTSVGARKQLPSKTPTVGRTLTKTTLLTPTGIKKIQAIPVGIANNKKSPVKASKNKYSTAKKNQTSIVVSRKRTAPLYVDSSGDSDEPLHKVAKRYPLNHKSVKKLSGVTSKKVGKSLSIRKSTGNNRETQIKKPKKNSVKAQKKNRKTQKSNYKKKMIQKRNQRISNVKSRVDYGYLVKRGVQNGSKGKKCTIAKKKELLQTKKQKKNLDDYLPLIWRYRHLIPERQPFVRIERIKFSAAYFTKDRIRLPSDIDLFRDGAAFYGLLGDIFSNLDLVGKLHVSQVCRFWNRALNEDAAWYKLPLINVVMHDLRPLERLILKRETKVILLENVDISGKAADYELCRLSCVKDLIVRENSSPLLLSKLLIACNELENVVSPDTNLDDFSNLNILIKSLSAENIIVSESENRLLKTWSDLEKLTVHSFDPTFYYNMGLLLSLKHLKLKQLSITNNISQFIENIPNIEYIEFAPEYSNINYTDGNKAIVESLKHCPSLKKLTWTIVKEIEIKKEKMYTIPIKAIKSEEHLVAEKFEENDNNSTTNEKASDSGLDYEQHEKMEVDECLAIENPSHRPIEIKTDKAPNTLQTHEDINVVQQNVTEGQDNKELFDCLKSSEDTETFALPEKRTKESEGNDKKDKVKPDLEEIKEDSVKDDNVSVKEERKDELLLGLINFEIDSLQLLALKTYLKSSLPECEVIFKAVKKYNYVD